MPESFCSVDFDEFICEMGIDKDTAKELYQVFRDELLDQKSSFLEAYEVKDFQKLQKIIHNIKGISGSYKAGHIYSTAQNIDLILKEKKFNDDSVKLLNELVNIMGETVSVINNFLCTV